MTVEAPFDLQLSAAATLKALDDRITLLCETNATLKAIAQALFKSWFVNFDPVRAKLESRARQATPLLPRLISGQLRLPEAQAAAEDALA